MKAPIRRGRGRRLPALPGIDPLFHPSTNSSRRVTTSFVRMWREGLRGGQGLARGYVIQMGGGRPRLSGGQAPYRAQSQLGQKNRVHVRNLVLEDCPQSSNPPWCAFGSLLSAEGKSDPGPAIEAFPAVVE